MKHSKSGILHLVCFLTISIVIVVPVRGNGALCEYRCERGILSHLKVLWEHRNTRRRLSGLSFKMFIRRLLIASVERNGLQRIHPQLKRMVKDYESCVRTCEHPHSKRSWITGLMSYRHQTFCS
ncbi:hypothetical protein ScPMuIL_013331 [Solemya velum]